MNLNDLFKKQIEEEHAVMLYFVLKEGDRECLQRYKHEEKESVIALLKDCKYIDTRIGIPRFERKAKSNVAKTSRKTRS
jgi:hypothetical protein